MRRNYFDRISVHCWGGLGSQLFAWAFAEQLRLKYPKKRIEIVFHTSGVTKRLPELGFLRPKFKLIYRDDYSEKISIIANAKNWKFNLTTILKKVLDILRLVNTSDRSTTISQIMPWTLSIRGHYSNLHVPNEIIQQMKLEIDKQYGTTVKKNSSSSETLGVHYRLGDLIQLKTKSFISPSDLGPVIRSVLINAEILKVVVHSDTIDELKRYLQSYLPENTEYVNSEIWETLLVLSANKYFIGSNSKISIWVILFQQLQGLDYQSWLPKSMSTNINNKFYGTFDFDNIHSY
jgi:hypothetical protein